MSKRIRLTCWWSIELYGSKSPDISLWTPRINSKWNRILILLNIYFFPLCYYISAFDFAQPKKLYLTKDSKGWQLGFMLWPFGDLGQTDDGELVSVRQEMMGKLVCFLFCLNACVCLWAKITEELLTQKDSMSLASDLAIFCVFIFLCWLLPWADNVHL